MTGAGGRSDYHIGTGNFNNSRISTGEKPF